MSKKIQKPVFYAKIKENPFLHFYPDKQLNPQNIVELFVKEYTELNALTAPTHTLVYGSRGSGKTMLFKFLEPACQAIVHGNLSSFFKKTDEAFIGIYISYNTGDTTIAEFNKILSDTEVDSSFVNNIVMHYFIMDIVDWTLETVLKQLRQRIVVRKEKDVVKKIASSLDKRKVHRNFLRGNLKLDKLQSLIAKEKETVISSIHDYQMNYGLPNNRLKYKGNFTNPSCERGGFLSTFFSELRELMALKDIPFYLLFDEVSEIEGKERVINFHQQIINTFISQRAQNLVCAKVSACHESYNSDQDFNGKEIQEIHDYRIINLDSLYTNNRENYYRRIEKIADTRLKLANWKITNIKKLIPESINEQQKMKQAIEYTAKEYDGLPKDKKIEDRNNYIQKYARARFFQKFFKKTDYGYTGFDNLVHFSSGVARAFLDVCANMVTEYNQKYPNKELSKKDFNIPFEIQKKSIESSSHKLIDDLLESAKKRGPDTEERRVIENLRNLLDALGGVFKIRLFDERSRNPRIISFAVSEFISNRQLEKVLRKGLRQCLFHKKWYRGKSGHEAFECFILNRRLCPHYRLDLSGFQGRIELSENQLLLAISDPKKFIRSFEKNENNRSKETEDQLSFFDV